MHTSDENKEKYQLRDYKLIQHQILQRITRIVWQTVRRITNEILGIKGLNTVKWLNCYTTSANQSKLIQAFQ